MEKIRSENNLKITNIVRYSYPIPADVQCDAFYQSLQIYAEQFEQQGLEWIAHFGKMDDWDSL